MRVKLTLDPHGDVPMTIPAEDFGVVCDALGLRGLGREIGCTRLVHDGVWALEVDGEQYRMVREDVAVTA